MPVNISQKHPTFELRSKIQEVSQNFFNSFGFSYFQYLRCFADGSVGYLTNNTSAFEYFQQDGNKPLVYSALDTAHSYWFLWDEKLPEIPVKIVRERCGIHNGLTYVRRTKHYYDMIAVGLPKEQENAGTFYLNKFKAIENFIFEFDKDNKDLIQVMTKNPIAIPERYRDENYKEMCLPHGKIKIAGYDKETYITSQEIACLRLLFQGFSHKVIAQTLNLSVRTVETYIQRVKQRTGFSSLKQVEKRLLIS
jgi:DNA-binding CsgD family transcriptional regulator